MAKKDQSDLNTKVDELTADLQRVHADFVNYRRRADDERAGIIDLAKRDVITTLLPLLDNLGRAISHLPEELTDNAWAKGVAAVAKQAEEALKTLGVDRIAAVGQEFDPHLHEAIGYEDGGEGSEVIIEEIQPGYRMGERVLRPAMVKVGKRKEGEK